MQYLGIIIGAVIALAGSILGQLLAHSFSEKRRRNELFREKAEHLMTALYDHAEWVVEKGNRVLFRQESHDQPSPLAKVEMIQNLYFPSLKKQMLEIRKCEQRLTTFIDEQRIKQLDNLNSWIESYDPTEYYEAYKDYLGAFEEYEMHMTAVVNITVKS